MSKRRSASSSRRDTPPSPTFFVDRSLGGIRVPAALRQAGLTVIAQDELGRPEDIDDEKLPALCGKNDWVFVTKDKLRERPIELETLNEARVRAFILCRFKLNGAETAQLLAGYASAMLRACGTRAGPFVGRIGTGLRFDDEIERKKRRAAKRHRRKAARDRGGPAPPPTSGRATRRV